MVYTGGVDLAAARAIFARYAHQFVVAYVFGSVAAGTADEHSDIDVIVVRHTTQPFFDRMREIMELRLEFGAADMLIYTPAELEQMLAEDGRYFVKQAVRKGYRIEGARSLRDMEDDEDRFSRIARRPALRIREANREADRWLRQAETDLAYATVGLREGFAAQVCFQCQQVCEKAIKALRHARGERVVIGHALVELAAPLEVMARFRDELAVLDQYYVPTRYPNGLPGGIPSDVYTRTQASASVDIARRIVAVVRRELAESTGVLDESALAAGETPPDAVERGQGTTTPPPEEADGAADSGTGEE